LGASGGAFTQLTDATPTSSTTSAIYRVVITDDYTTTNQQITVNFRYIIFYGDSDLVINNSSKVRSLTNKRFIDDADVFILNTGTINQIFGVAMTVSKSLVSVIDLDALNADITGNYPIATFNVNDASGVPTSYKVYSMVNAVTYPANHRHQITIS